MAEAIPGRGIYSEAARQERQEFLKNELGLPKDFYFRSEFQADKLQGNIENYIGSVSIPVGVAGPLIINFTGSEVYQSVFIPIGTSEGALLASATRGAKSFSLSGGVRTRVIAQTMNRVPSFYFSSIDDALWFRNWVLSKYSELKAMVKESSRFADLQSVVPQVMGDSVNLEFRFSTGDAAGQNMTTIATNHLCQWLIQEIANEKKVTLQGFMLEAGLSSDKKASFRSVLKGRGFEVVSEGIIKSQVMQQQMKCTVDEFVKNFNRTRSNQIQIGMTGWNINVANIVAGVFTATGQDIACVHECSVAELFCENRNGDLYVRLYFPNLIVGNVGGGTHLPDQQKYLQLMGCSGPGDVGRIAEMIAGFALGLEVSTFAAIVSGQFADAHRRLGRTNKKSWIQKKEIDADFLEKIFGQRILSSESIAFAAGDSLLMDAASRFTQKLTGFHAFQAEIEEGSRASKEELLLKIKPTDAEVKLAALQMTQMLGEQYRRAYELAAHSELFTGSHLKEMSIAALKDSSIAQYLPVRRGVLVDRDRDLYVLGQSMISDFQLEPSSRSIKNWSNAQVLQALRAAAQFHGQYLGRDPLEISVPEIQTKGRSESKAADLHFAELVMALAGKEHPDWMTPEIIQCLRFHLRQEESRPEWNQFKTLIHNDFNPRNLGFRKNGDFVILDWELASWNWPQRDAIELIAFVLSQRPSRLSEAPGDMQIDKQEAMKLVKDWIEEYTCCLNLNSRAPMSPALSFELAYQGLIDLVLYRLPLYIVAHQYRECDFLPSLVRSCAILLEGLSAAINEKEKPFEDIQLRC